MLKHQLELSSVWFWSEGVCKACGTRGFVLGGMNRLKAGFDRIECED
ncbi:hypothetical protein PBI_MIMI_278 [Arthrobacter phage Mimi]|nr:hypothetical protein PBI_MIMI_72 [Arthrobacter phage Mimi]